jgi:uncharacterized membrane protein
MIRHLIIFGALGLTLEVLFTGFHGAIIERNVKATGTTYLWMFPIYGLAGVGFEGLKYILILGTLPLILRVFVYLIIIYIIEYVSGWLLKKATGSCPWEYKNKWSINGFVRLDYAPFWFALCWLIEPIQVWVEKMFCE